MYFYGKKTGEEYCHHSPIYRTPVRASAELCFDKECQPIYGGVYADYSVFTMDDGDPIENRVNSGQLFELIWTNNEITGVSMAPEDQKPILKISVQNNKSLILADGIDSFVLELRLVDDADDPIPFSGDIMAPIKTPKMHSKLVKMTFVNGSCDRVMKTLTSGEWMFPSSKPTTFRFFDDPIVLNSYDEGDLV